MITLIKDGKIIIDVGQFLENLPIENRMFLAREALYEKNTLKIIINEIINGPDKPSIHEVRKELLEHMPEIHQKLVRSLLSVIEVQNRRLKSANDRSAKLWYDWPRGHIGERPKEPMFDPPIHIIDEDAARIIKEYFERKANENRP